MPNITTNHAITYTNTRLACSFHFKPQRMRLFVVNFYFEKQVGIVVTLLWDLFQCDLIYTKDHCFQVKFT